MIEHTAHGDVTAYRLSWWRSRAIGYSVHVYVSRGVMIDTGFPAAHRDVAHVVRHERVRGIYVTHQHEDHAGNVSWLAHRGLPLAIDPATLAVLRHPPKIGLYRHITWRNMRPVTAAIVLFADNGFTMVHTPGHSPDHHAVWDANTGTLFAGDLFLGVRVKVAHAYEDPRAQVRSLREMVALTPTRVFCAHRGLLRDGVGLLTAKADWMEEMIGRIDALDADGRSVGAIREEVLGARDSTHWFSAGDYSPDNLVRAVIASRDANLRAHPGEQSTH